MFPVASIVFALLLLPLASGRCIPAFLREQAQAESAQAESATDNASINSAQHEISRRLTEELQAEFPDLPSLLAQDPASAKGGSMYAEILRLFQAVKSSTVEKQPALLLAVDLLSDKWPSAGEEMRQPSPALQKDFEELGAYGLTYRWEELGGGWFPVHDLLLRIQLNYPDSSWAEAAFVLLLLSGWDKTGGCASGPNEFRDVIKQGQTFLEAHPRSRHRAIVSLLVGEAYETWWSMSLLAPCRTGQETACNEEVDPLPLRDGAEAARTRAIEIYTRIAESNPGTPEANYARQVLPLIAAGKDTHQRRFYCVND